MDQAKSMPDVTMPLTPAKAFSVKGMPINKATRPAIQSLILPRPIIHSFYQSTSSPTRRAKGELVGYLYH